MKGRVGVSLEAIKKGRNWNGDIVKEMGGERKARAKYLICTNIFFYIGSVIIRSKHKQFE